MHRIPTTSLIVIAASLLIATSTGCRNRCNQPCGGGLFAGNTTIAPASTYSLNIPSVAQNQPYYNRGNGGPITTTAQAPTPATGSSNSGLQWRQSGNGQANPRGTNFGAQPNQPNNNTVTTPATRLVETNPAFAPKTGTSVLAGGVRPVASGSARVAAAPALPATGTSFVNSRNFATTSTDERTDPTLIPVTDATRVRAAAQTFIAGSAVQNQRFATNQPFQTFAAQPAVQPQQSVYSANGMVLAQPVQPYASGTTFLQPQNNYAGQVYIQPGVAAPASYTASASNATGWRNREIGSQR